MEKSSNEILKKIRKIEIRSRSLSQDVFAGKYHSAFRGHGMSFSEVREYRIGDDVRDIDWNVTARSRSPHIKIYEEERELTMILVIDVSGSGKFGSSELTKRELTTEIAAILAFSAIENNDKVGCLFFSDKIEKYIPPKKGRSHVLAIIRELLEFKPEQSGTSLSEPLVFLTNMLKKRAAVFVLSDFLDGIENDTLRCEDALKIASKKHDIVGIRVYDRHEIELPNIGLMEFKDLETARRITIDTSSSRVREIYALRHQKVNEIIDNALKRSRVDNTRIATDDDYVKSLIKLFAAR
ncbi:MAG: DUF58 domain-containing protein [Rikenellaceae bacterium]